MTEFRRSHEALVCTHCGEKNRMSVIGHVSDTTEHASDIGPPHESGTLYEIQSCPACEKIVLVAGAWDDMMDGPEDASPSVVLPEPRDRAARVLLSAHDLDLQCMHLAVAEARKCKSEGDVVRPRVGAVVAKGGVFVESAYRGELAAGEHAEYTLLEGKCENLPLAGATIYTTLEPCTTRNRPKMPCVERLIGRKVSRVVIGMLDPDERIRGRGVLALRKANIRVDLFPPDLMTELEELNREFIAARERTATGPDIEGGVNHAGDSDSESALATAARKDVTSLAKYILATVRRLPDGSQEAIAGADRLIRDATLPTDEDLAQLRRSASTVGSSIDESALAAIGNVAWMLRIARQVQDTSRDLGFDYRRIDWGEWTLRWAAAEQALVSLVAT